MMDSRARHPAARRDTAGGIGPPTLAGLRAAFGPQSYYWHVNTAADTWADWRAYLAAEPGGTLRGYARLLLHHEARRWGTAPWPLMRRLVAFLRRHGGRPGPEGPGHPRARDAGPLRTGGPASGRAVGL